MKRCIAICAILLAVSAFPAVSSAQMSKPLADMVAKTSGALAVLKYTVEIQTGDRTGAGQAICISKAGVFLTTSLDPRLRVEDLKEFQLVLPGVGGKSFKAKLLGIDPWTGLGFVQCLENHDWQVVQFSRTSNLKLGDPLMSIGLMLSDPSWPVYVGTGYVGSRLRVPNEVIYVAGGGLTGACSPVFAADGRAIGIVARQLPMGYETPTQRGMAPLRLVDQQRTLFFTPVEEFVHAIEKMPTDGKVARLPWLGINKFEALPKDTADMLKLSVPGVKILDVIPNQPAAKAGLEDRDIIVEVDGKPIEELATANLTVQNFVRQLMRMKAGTIVKLKVHRGVTGMKEVAVKLEEMPIRPNEAKQYYSKQIGLVIREQVPLDEYIDKSGSSAAKGVVVVAVARNSPSALADVRPGDVITIVNNKQTKSADEFKVVLEGSLVAGPTNPIQVLVRRGEENLVLTVRPTTGS